jgi:hypothetical protein
MAAAPVVGHAVSGPWVALALLLDVTAALEVLADVTAALELLADVTAALELLADVTAALEPALEALLDVTAAPTLLPGAEDPTEDPPAEDDGTASPASGGGVLDVGQPARHSTSNGKSPGTLDFLVMGDADGTRAAFHRASAQATPVLPGWRILSPFFAWTGGRMSPLLSRSVWFRVQTMSFERCGLSRLGFGVVALVALLGCKPPTTTTVPTQGVTAATHQWFPIVQQAGIPHALERVVSGGGTIQCSSCHEASRPTFKEFTCVGCHEHSQLGSNGLIGMDELHRGKQGYAYDSASCLRCHPQGESGEIARADHDRYFPIDTATSHGFLACAECHNGNSRQTVTCVGCHRDNNNDTFEDHATAPMQITHGSDMTPLGYKWESPACLSCHPRSQDPGLLNHEAEFPIAAGTIHGTAQTSCRDCHTSRQDHTQLDCLSCHNQVDDGTGLRDVHGQARMGETHTADTPNGPVPLVGYNYESRTCYLCHQSSQVPGQVQHETFFPIGMGTTHALDTDVDDDLTDNIPAVRVSCTTCHQDPSNSANVTCTQCHAHNQAASQTTHQNIPDYAWDSPRCVFCHFGGQVRIDHTFFPTQAGSVHALDDSATPALDGLSCSECHTSPTDRRAVACVDCHRDSNNDSFVDHGQEPMLAAHGADMGALGYAWNSTACLTCHDQSQVPGLLDHEGEFPTAPGTVHGDAPTSCVDCHTTRADHTQIDCISCHQQEPNGTREIHSEARLAEKHAQGMLPGYAWESRACYTCHQASEIPGVIQHEALFPIGVGTVHELNKAIDDDPNDAFPAEVVTCQSCHQDPTTQSNVTCTSCHAHAQAVMQPTHGSFPDYQWNSQQCLFCHAGGQTRLNHTFFPTGAGTPHAADDPATPLEDGLTCRECHTSNTDRRAVTCTTCHRDSNGDGVEDHAVSPMLAVHGTDMAALGYSWTSSACFNCHNQAQVPGTMNHDPAFPTGVGTVHGDAAITCADCHTSRTDHRLLQCITCHTPVDDQTGAGPRDVHGDVRMAEKHDMGLMPGYAWESRSCFACHQRSQVPGEMEHDAFFPIGAGAVHELGAAVDDDPLDAVPAVTVECITCHQDPLNQRNVTCTDCHAHEQAVMQPTHGTFPDYLWDSTSCVFCHLGGAKNINHTFFPVEPGQSHVLDNAATPLVEGLSCSDCHASQLDRRQLACTGCHTGNHSAATSTADHGAEMSRHGYAFDSGACFGCHPTSQVPGLFDHEPIYPLLPPSGAGQHQGLQCTECHSNKADRVNSLTCTACHTPVSASDTREVHGQPYMGEVHAGFMGYVWSPRVCISCHTDGTVNSALQNIDHTWFPVDTGTTHALTAKGGTMDCAECHTTPGDFQVATIGCVTCHDQTGGQDTHGQTRMNTTHAGVSGYQWASPECVACHPQGQPAGNFDHTRFPIATGSAHQMVSCSECHNGTGPKTDVNQLLCAQCHTATVNTNPTVAQIHNGIPDYMATSPACFNCHPNSEPVGPMDHTAFFPIAAGSAHASAAYMAEVNAGQTSCSACHASRVDRTQNLCFECHQNNGIPTTVLPSLATSHPTNRIRDVYTNSPMCKACHADSQVQRLAQHSAFSSSHEGSKCLECHSNLTACLANTACANATGQDNAKNNLVLTAYRTDKPWGVDFNQYACLKCHKHSRSREEQRHQGETRNGFTFRSYANPGCANCH